MYRKSMSRECRGSFQSASCPGSLRLHFPLMLQSEEITVEQPLLTVDRQMGLVIVAPQGKDARTVFRRIGYDAQRDQSIVKCKPLTGRSELASVTVARLTDQPIRSGSICNISDIPSLTIRCTAYRQYGAKRWAKAEST